MKTVLFFDHTASLGGGEIALLRLVSALDKRRFKPVVLLAAEGKLHAYLADVGIETHLLPLASAVRETRKETIGAATLGSYRLIADCWAYVRRMADFMRSRKVDLLHTNSLKSDLIGGFAARSVRVPLLWHIRDRIASDYLPSAAAFGFRRLCKILPSHIIANSEATLKTLGRARRRATVVYDGMPISPDVERPQPPDDPPVIGILGRISPWKGQDIFIRAARLVRERFSTARFRIIGAPLFGEEKYERELRQLVHNLALDDAVEFAGFQENVKQELERLSVVVHASTIAEPFGQVVFEAMYYSKPVIATKAGGVPEIVDDQETGILVPMGDANAMANAVISLLENPGKARRMGVAGRERILNHFTIQQTARNVEAIYEKILG